MAHQTAMEEWLDAMLRHQIGLQRVAGGIRNDVWALLDATEKDVRRAITDNIRGGQTVTPTRLRRLERVLAEIQTIRAAAWSGVDSLLIEQMRELSVREPEFLDRALRSTMPVSLNSTIPDARRLQAIVGTFPFQGTVLREHTKRLGARDVQRIEDQIRIGLVQGETGQQLAGRVVGTQALGGSDGVTALSRRQAEALTRTATSAIAAEATRTWTLENDDIFTVNLFVATLDSRTTPICRSLDGQTFPIESQYPRLPLHWNERSRLVPMVDEEAIGNRPMKPTTEKGLLREFSAQEGFGPPITNRATLPRGTQGRFDKFARSRTRELIGQVPAKTTYQQWLGRQSAGFQDDVLGNAKGKLFRKGGLTLDKFVMRDGTEITLSQLARTEAAAFKAAGLDPKAFL